MVDLGREDRQKWEFAEEGTEERICEVMRRRAAREERETVSMYVCLCIISVSAGGGGREQV